MHIYTLQYTYIHTNIQYTQRIDRYTDLYTTFWKIDLKGDFLPHEDIRIAGLGKQTL